MRGLEEEIQKFTLKVKELVESMQKRIKDQNEKKLAEIKVSFLSCRNLKGNWKIERKKLKKRAWMQFTNLKESSRIR